MPVVVVGFHLHLYASASSFDFHTVDDQSASLYRLAHVAYSTAFVACVKPGAPRLLTLVTH